MATITKGKTFVNGELVTPEKLHQLVDSATVANITNADIAAGAAIADTKLATISTANKVAQSAVTNLTTDLAGKAASIHQHAIADTTGLQTALDGKAASSHTHTIANVTGLQTALDGKQASGSYAASSHTHSAADITSGTLSNSRTTATSEATANAIVARESSGGTKINWVLAYSPGFNSGIYSVYAPGSVYIGGILSNNTNTGLIYSTASDYRLKTDLEKLTGALDRLSALPVHRFKWVGYPAAPKVDGFLAHEAQAVVPESVTGTKDEVDAEGKPIYQGIDQSKLVPLLVAAVQELAARVAALEAK
jgi:hypothetical protein